MRLLGAIILLLLFPTLCLSATYYVPDHFSTIQGAISDTSVVDGDIIIVRDGLYSENLNFLGKAITVKSENGPNSTTIDGTGSGSVVSFVNGEGKDSVLEGIALVNGSGTYVGAYAYGGGIFCDNASSPTLRDNIMAGSACDYGAGLACTPNCHPLVTGGQIVGNSALKNGAGVYAEGSNIVLRDVFLAGNKADEGGGGVFIILDSNPIIEGCSFTGNTAPGTVAHGGAMHLMLGSGSAHAYIRNNEIYGNQASGAGGGLYLMNSSATLLNNSVMYNNSGTQGGGIYVSGGSQYTYLLRDSILWQNSSSISGFQIYKDTGTDLTVAYCDVMGDWVGTGNFDADPLFTGGSGGSFFLSQVAAGQAADSPCLDAGSNQAVNVGMNTAYTRTDQGLDTGTVDIGHHYGDYSAHSLDPDGYQISVAAGGIVPMTLIAGPENTGRSYLILGSVTGTSPGTPLPGGQVTLPINWDVFTELTISLSGSPLFLNYMGALNTWGGASATLDCTSVTLPSSVIGLKIHFAFGLPKPWDFASNAVMVEFVP